jgi:hypothetical protein
MRTDQGGMMRLTKKESGLLNDALMDMRDAMEEDNEPGDLEALESLEAKVDSEIEIEGET